MGTWTITTTSTEDAAIDHAYQQAQKPALPGMLPPPVGTIEEFFQQRITTTTVATMVALHRSAKNTTLVDSLMTVPEATRPAAKADIEAVIMQHGGTVPVTDTT